MLKKIKSSSRPVLMVGNGVRMSGKIKDFSSFAAKLNIPIVTAWNAHDIILDSNKNYVGRPGTIGDRAGNFAVQNSDCLIILGSRLNIRQISYNWSSFARKAYKIWVDIDPLELKKPNLKPDMPLNLDLKDLIPKLNLLTKKDSNKEHASWLRWCVKRKLKYKVVKKDFWNTKKINPYTFFDSMFNLLDGGEVMISANATPSIAGFQAAIIKKNQRLWANSGCAGMGYDLPASIGAYYGAKNKKIICLAGDGSIMMNIQELQTIKNYNLPIKIIIFNNDGYVSIYQSQKNHFKREVGASPKSNVTFPSFKKISKGFEIEYTKISDHKHMKNQLRKFLNKKYDKPRICEVFLDGNFEFQPKLSAKILASGKIVSPNLEDLYPFLSKEELNENMLIS